MTSTQDGSIGRHLFDLLPDAVLTVDRSGRIGDINSQAAAMFGYAGEEVRGQPVEMLIPARFRARHLAHRAHYREAPRRRPMGAGLDLYGRRKDGSEFPVDIMLSPLAEAAGRLTVAVVRDVSERRRLQEEERQAKETLGAVIDAAPVAIFCLSPDRRVLVWSRAAEELFGYAAAETLGRVYPLVPPDRAAEFERLFARALDGETLRNIDVRRRRKDGTLVDISFAVAPLYNADGTIRGVACAGEDITERLKAREKLHRLAYHDPLTGLPNRSSLQNDVDEHLRPDAAAPPRPLAIAMLDIDGFRDVNDTLGHSSGDSLLREVARRMDAAAAGQARIYRIGGDEFAAMFPGCGDPRLVARTVGAMLDLLGQVFEIEGQPVHIGASAGIAIAPVDDPDAEKLVADAGLAMDAAKSDGGRRYRLYDPTLRARAQARRTLGVELRHAFSAGEFELFFQPQIRLSDGALAGAEALLRWRHPGRGIIPPALFIDALATSPIAGKVGNWILRTACGMAATWRAEGLPHLRIGVNLFAAQVYGGGLVREVEAALDETGLPAEALELEITENIALRHNAAVLRLLRTLRERGIGVAFDDFGTGYASLSSLARYPLSRIKIDRSFLRDLSGSVENAAIVRSLIAMARHLRLDVIAEGVETGEQRDFLFASGCREGQGFLFSRPLPAEDFGTFLRARGAPAPQSRAARLSM